MTPASVPDLEIEPVGLPDAGRRAPLSDIPGVVLFTPARHSDERGFFSETFRLDAFRERVGEVALVQENHSLTRRRGSIRGLHCQAPPRAQGKLMRVTRGAVFDVVVDARRGSPTFGRHATVELSAENWRQLWAPPGLLHGFCTLTDDVEFLYRVTDYYSPEHDRAVAYDDPALGIAWPRFDGPPLLSAKDRLGRPFSELEHMFPADAAPIGLRRA